MNWKRLVTALLAGGQLWACSNDPSGPGAGPGSGPGSGPGTPGTGEVSATATDPTGDTFGNRGTPWDLTRMTVTRDTDAVTVVLEFSFALISPTSGDSNAMLGFVDFETDDDSTNGNPTVADEFRRDAGSTGIKSDYLIALNDYAADSTVPVFDESGTITGRVKPVFSGKKVTIRVPRTMLGNDDGFLSAAAIVGTEASPTDIIPQQGHLELRDTASVGSVVARATSGRACPSRAGGLASTHLMSGAGIWRTPGYPERGPRVTTPQTTLPLPLANHCGDLPGS